MATWRATLRVGTRLVEATVTDQGDIDPPELEDEILEHIGDPVDLTATGPTVPLSFGDPNAISAWLADRYEVVDGHLDDDWPVDPRTVLPDGALG
jgi:hypothetical protein